MKQHRLILAIILIVSVASGISPLMAQENVSKADTATTSESNGIIQRIIRYFSESNRDRPDKKFDVTFIGGPSYSEATSIQLAIMAAGVYHTRRDSITPMSEATIFAQGSVTGLYRVGIRGCHYSPGDKYRITYDADFAHFPLEFWGIGYENNHLDANETDYTELQANLSMGFSWRLPHNIFIGPILDFHYAKATKAESTVLWEGQDLRTFSYGMGISLSYDTRDYASNASNGWNVRITQEFFPRFFGNDYPFSLSELTIGWYKQFWQSGVWAFQLHGCATYGDTPWSMLPTIDKSNSIRGYYEGRYRNKNEVDLAVELRQRVWNRIGIVVWGGVGTVFKNPDEVNINTLLPSYGLGLRWELKKKVNIRLDFGIGKHSTGLSIGMNETF